MEPQRKAGKHNDKMELQTTEYDDYMTDRNSSNTIITWLIEIEEML